MRPVAVVTAVTVLGALSLAVVASGCRCNAPPSATPGTTASAAGAAASPDEAPVPRAPWKPAVDCDQLLGAERASKVMGRALVSAQGPELAASECRYVPAGTAAGAPPAALVEVLFACRDASAAIARSVLMKAGGPKSDVNVGQKGVLLGGEGERGVVRFLDRNSPCAVQVITLPADKALDVAREVERGLGAVRVAP